jgi:hypothetical protein
MWWTTILIKSLVSNGELAKPVVGIPIPLFNNNCKENNLSLDCVMAFLSLNYKLLKLQIDELRHNRKSNGLILGIIASNWFKIIPP